MEDNSILHVLKSSIDRIWSVRKRAATPTKRLEIPSSSYLTKEKFSDTSMLTIIPEVHEERCSLDQSNFLAKIEYITPKKPAKEAGLSSATSQFSDFQEPGKKTEKKSLIRDDFSSDKVIRAKKEIECLKKNKERLQEKIAVLSQSLNKLQEIRLGKYTKNLELSSQENKDIQVPENDASIVKAALNLQNLESEIKSLQLLKHSSIYHYEEELSNINRQLRDLQECNEILIEILDCFKKETCPPNECLFPPQKTIPNTANSEEPLSKIRTLEEQLIITKQILEKDLRDIPDNSKTLLNKALSLEHKHPFSSS